MIPRKIGKILSDLEEALVLAGLSEEDAEAYVDGAEEELEELLADDEDSSETDSETA
jgi:phosphatidylserine decarboxylase